MGASASQHHPVTTNLFFFRTEIEALCSAQIANHCDANETALLFAQNDKALAIARLMTSQPIQMLDNQARGFFSRTRELLAHIRHVRQSVAATGNPARIVIHVSRLLNSTVNFYIQDLINHFPQAHLAVHIIPHGINSQLVMPLSRADRFKVILKKYSRCYLGISYFSEIHDKYGFTAPITEKIYAIPGLEHVIQQFHKHVEAVPLSRVNALDVSAPDNGRMLVIGQKWIYDFHATPSDYTRLVHLTEAQHTQLVEKLKQLAIDYGVSGVDYLPHPRRKEVMELYDPSFHCLETSQSCEMIVLQNKYRVIASFSSTALIFARLLSGNNGTTVLSVGTEASKRPEVVRVTRELMENIGVRLLTL
ncbi:MAG TPA: hypothetical protein PLF22_05125 [Pseudomonadales bacterium]|nr:hypothetical protein [Pseudomonadales bacterium]